VDGDAATASGATAGTSASGDYAFEALALVTSDFR